jgi:cleavage and polyadenylation specificity factor subunit 3
LGELAVDEAKTGNKVSGVLVCRDFKYNLISANELEEYTPDLVPATFEQTQYIPCRAPFSIVKWLIECMFEHVVTIEDKESLLVFNDLIFYQFKFIKVLDTIKVINNKMSSQVTVEWESNHMNDMIADSIVGIIIQAESSPASVKGMLNFYHF